MQICIANRSDGSNLLKLEIPTDIYEEMHFEAPCSRLEKETGVECSRSNKNYVYVVISCHASVTSREHGRD